MLTSSSRQDDFNRNLKHMKESFYCRGYDAKQIQAAEQKKNRGSIVVSFFNKER